MSYADFGKDKIMSKKREARGYFGKFSNGKWYATIVADDDKITAYDRKTANSAKEACKFVANQLKWDIVSWENK